MNRSSQPLRSSTLSKSDKAGWLAAETTVLVAALSKSLRQGLADHQSMLDILLDRGVELPLPLGELLEDASNVYMEMSENVSRQFLNARSQVPE